MMMTTMRACAEFALLALATLILGAGNAGAVIAQRGATTSATATSTTLTINKPAGVVAGDVMLATIASFGTVATVQTTPVCAGWTLVKSGNLRTSTNYPYGAVMYRVADGTEGTNFAFTLGAGTVNAVGDIMAFSGVDATGGVNQAGTAASGPFDVTPGAFQVNTSTGTTLTPAAITTTTANAAVVLCAMAGGASSVAWSAWTTGSPGSLTLTEVADHATTSASVGAAWATKAAAGSTGSGSVTLISSRRGGLLIALRPKSTATLSTVSASPASVPADGSTTVTVTLKDADNNLLAGKDVSLLKTGGAGTGTPTITTLTGTTGTDGVATFTVTCTTAGVYVFTATDVTDGNLTINQTATVTWLNATDISNTLTPWEPANTGAGVKIDVVVPAGNIGRLVGTTQTHWGSGGFSRDVFLNGNTLIIDSGNGNGMNVSGSISGNGTLIFQAGKLVPMHVSGSTGNTYTGTTTIYEAYVSLDKTSGDALRGAITLNNAGARIIWTASNQISDTSDVTLSASSAVLNLAGFSDTINDLYLVTGTQVQTGVGGILKVARLFINGVQQPNVAKATGDGYVTGSGYIDVGNSGPPVIVSPPATPATPSPVDGVTTIHPATFTKLDWADSSGAASYDVYFWKPATEAKPATPTANALLSEYTPGSSLLSLTNYKWQVVAKNSVGNTAGPEWSFTTLDRRDISNDLGIAPQGSAAGILIDDTVGLGNTGRLVGTTRSHWSSAVVSVDLNLNGNLLWIERGGNGPFSISGAISGDGLLTIERGLNVSISGGTGNTYTGTTTMKCSATLAKSAGDALCGTISVTSGSTLTWANSNQISDTSDVTLAQAGSILNLAGYSDTIASLTLTAGTTVDTGADGVLTVTSLTVNGAAKLPGTYTSSSSFVMGTGSVVVLGVTPPASAGLSTVTAAPGEVVADGSTAATVTVKLLDSSGNPATGKSVKLTSSRGTADTISASSGVSNASGVVTFSVTSVTAGSPVFTAKDLTDGNLTITATATMTFTPGPPTVKITNLVDGQVLRYSMVLVDGTFDAGPTLTITAAPSSANLSLTKCANRFRCLVDLQPGTNTLTLTDSHDPVTINLIFTPPTATDYRYKIWYVVPSDEANSPVDPDYAIHFGLQTKLMQSWMAEDQMRAGNGRLTIYPELVDGTNTVDVGKLVVTQTRAQAEAIGSGMYSQVWSQLPAQYKDGRHKNVAFTSVAFHALSSGDLAYVGAYQNIFPNSSTEMMTKLLSTASYGSDSLTFATYSGVTLHEIIHGIHSIWHDFSPNNIMGGAYDISRYFTLTHSASNPAPHNDAGAATLGTLRDLASWNRYLMSPDPRAYHNTSVGVTAGPEYLTATSAYPLAIFHYYLPSTAVDLHDNLADSNVTTYSKHAGQARLELGAHPFNIMAVDTEGNMSYTTFNAAKVPVVPVADSYAVSQGANVIAAPGVLANDYNPSTSTLTATLATNVQHGTLVLNSNGGFTYTPDTSHAGADTFTYTVSDGITNDQQAVVTLTTPPAEIPAFDTWVGTGTGGKGLSGAAAAFDADPDHDCIPNGIEFVIGGEPNPANPLSNSLALLPTVEASGNNLVFTFIRRDEAAYLNPVVEFATDLAGPWITAGAGNATIAVFDGTPADTVRVTIPKGANSRLFARLKVGTGTVTGGIPPRLTTAPLDTTVTNGWDLTLTTAVEGSQPVTLQWYFNGSAITGATAGSYTVAGAGSANQGDYQVVASNAHGTATSAMVHVTVSPAAGPSEMNLVPWPISVQPAAGVLTIPAGARIVATDAALLDTANVLATEITAAHARTLPVVTTAPADGDIVLALDVALTGERHTLIVDTRATVRGGDAFSVSLGSASLLQALRTEAGLLGCPRVTIDDTPTVAIRALHLDLARQNHSLESLFQAVDLCRLYKVNYLHLHFNDDQAYTFPSTAFPLLNTVTTGRGRLVYTLAEMQSLEAYAVARGVHIMPELEGPGHNALMLAAYPALFKITYPITEIALYEPSSSVNIAKAEVRAAWRTLIGEMCAVFQSTPYMHLGCDEVDWAWSEYNADFQALFAEWGFTRTNPRQNVSLVFSKFITLARDYAAEFGKQSIVWENNEMNGAPEVPPPSNILVMPFDSYNPIKFTTYGTGMKLVNAAWGPLYAVTDIRKKVSTIYAWNRTIFGQFSTTETYFTYVVPAQHVLGAQFTTFEQVEDLEMVSVRARLPAMNERIWNPNLGATYADFRSRLTRTDALLDALLSPVMVSYAGLDDLDDRIFSTPATVSLRLAPGSAGQGLTIRYTTSATNVTNTSTLYTGPFQVTTGGVLRAAAFNASGQRVGRMVREFYRH